MNTKIVASLAILVLVIGAGSHILYNSAEAKGMPKCWLNADGTVKAVYLKVLKGTSAGKYTLPSGLEYCQYHK